MTLCERGGAGVMLAVLCTVACEPSQRHVSVLEEVRSPNGLHAATLYWVSAGGAASARFWVVSLRPAQEPFFARTTRLEREFTLTYPNTPAGLRWKGDGLLQIRFCGDQQRVQWRDNRRRFGDVVVELVPNSEE